MGENPKEQLRPPPIPGDGLNCSLARGENDQPVNGLAERISTEISLPLGAV